MKISVILPTNKKNSQEELDKLHKIADICWKYADPDIHHPIFNWDFTSNVTDWVTNCEHILEPTLGCLFQQTSKDIGEDYEVLICHKYPEDAKEIIESFNQNENFRLIKEKASIWHKLGNEYPTVNNNRNTGIIHAKGELLLFLDDMTIFSPYLLQRAWEEYQNGYYITARGRRRIRYDPNIEPTKSPTRKTLIDKGIHSSYNFKRFKDGDIILPSATWTYCCTISLEDALRINGFDELWDGNFGGTDQDFGRRLTTVSKMKRKLVYEIYEFAHRSPRQNLRNDEILRQICGQMFPNHIRANEWKPTENEMKQYEKWHRSNVGYLDPDWRRFLDIPMYNLADERIGA